jgi:hypothetical protein
MAYYNERWPERQHPRDYDRQDWRDWDRDRDRNMWNRDRSMWDRTRDEVRSWAGDEDAERRRRWDEMRDRNWEYGRRDSGVRLDTIGTARRRSNADGARIMAEGRAGISDRMSGSAKTCAIASPMPLTSMRAISTYKSSTAK